MPSQDTSRSMELARDLLCRQGVVERYFLAHDSASDAAVYQFWRGIAETIFKFVSDELEKLDPAELGRIASCGRGKRVRLGTRKGEDPIPVTRRGHRTPRSRSVPTIHLPIHGGDPDYDGMTKLRLLAAQAVVADLKDLFKATIQNQVARRQEHALARA